ncbi:unnamed protein product [Ixodes hexagonus]
MSRRDANNPANNQRAADSDDNEFGEFEGFEGAVGGVVAHPAPSPWATFPDLIRVRTSPGGGTANNIANDGLLPQHPETDSPSSSRSRNPNPPDVSLHARDSGSNSNNDDVNLLNFIPGSHQRVGGTLPDMAVESELRHTMQASSAAASSSGAPRDHIAEVRPTLRGSTHARGGAEPGTLASMAAANVQRTSGLPRSNRAPCGARDSSPARDWVPDAAMGADAATLAASLRESNAALTRRLSASESRVRELESQLRELRERESRSDRHSQDVVRELEAIRETLASHERATRSLAECVQGHTDRETDNSDDKKQNAEGGSDSHSRTGMEDRLASIEASLERLCAKVSNLPVLERGPAGAEGAGSAGLLTREDIAQAVQEVLSRQSTQQKSLLEDERRRLMQSFAESFQVAISQFLQSLNSDNLDS